MHARGRRRGKDGKDQLHDLAHGAYRGGVGLPGGPAGDDTQDERQAHRNQSQPDTDVKGEILDGEKSDRDWNEAGDQPRERHFDRGHALIQLRRSRVVLAAPENTEGTRNCLPLQRERGEAGKHHGGSATPERPAREMVDRAAADERNGDLVGCGTEMGGIEGDQRGSHP